MSNLSWKACLFKLISTNNEAEESCPENEEPGVLLGIGESTEVEDKWDYDDHNGDGLRGRISVHYFDKYINMSFGIMYIRYNRHHP